MKNNIWMSKALASGRECNAYWGQFKDESGMSDYTSIKLLGMKIIHGSIFLCVLFTSTFFVIPERVVPKLFIWLWKWQNRPLRKRCVLLLCTRWGDLWKEHMNMVYLALPSLLARALLYHLLLYLSLGEIKDRERERDEG